MYLFVTSAINEVSGQLHVLADYILLKEFKVPSKHEAW
jgi:hypothetical protein